MKDNQRTSFESFVGVGEARNSRKQVMADRSGYSEIHEDLSSRS